MLSERPLHILVPSAGASTSTALMSVASSLLDCYGGAATVLSVVEVPENRSLSEGALVARRRRDLLRRLEQSYPEHEVHGVVSTAHSLTLGIRESALDTDASLLLLDWRPARRISPGSALDELIEDPPCNLALVKLGKCAEITTVLLPVRGGPHARLALAVAHALAQKHRAVLTLLHVEAPLWDRRRRVREIEYFEAVRQQVTYTRTQYLQVESDDIEATLLDQGGRHDLVVMGAAARDESSPYPLGRIPATIARRLDGMVIVVKTQEPVTLSTFGITGLSSRTGSSGGMGEERDLSALVDRWFAENTFHSHEFRDLSYLMRLKERQGRTISLALPTLNEEKTVGKIVSTIKRELVDRVPLIDEFVVIDSQSEDRTVDIVSSLGIPVFQHAEILPEHGSFRGKGEALWKSLCVTSGDILVWIDSDITGMHPKFVYGLIGPLLSQPHLGFVKGFYRRPLNLGDQRLTTGGGRVTELTARPLINLFYPQLSGLVQPLAGEMAGRRDVLEAVPFFTGYGVETGLLIDILEDFGLRSIAQTDLEERIHRNQSLFSLSKMAFAIIQVVVQRLGDRNRLALLEEVNTSMKLIHYSPRELFLEVKEIQEHERPPMKSIGEYATSTAGSRRNRSIAGVSESGEVQVQIQPEKRAKNDDASDRQRAAHAGGSRQDI